jgi:hypothetical protein
VVSLAEAMDVLHMPSASVALIHAGRIDWSRTFGMNIESDEAMIELFLIVNGYPHLARPPATLLAGWSGVSSSWSNLCSGVARG